MRLKLFDQIAHLPRSAKRILALAVDAVLCLVTVAMAFWFRLGEWFVPNGPQWSAYALSVILAVPVFIKFGLYRAIFRYAGWGALVSVSKACAAYGIAYATIFVLFGVPSVPRTIGAIQPVLLFVFVGASRATARYWLGGEFSKLAAGKPKRVLIYGAGAAGRQLAAALDNGNEMQVVAFVDDDKSLQGNVLNGKVIYSSDDLAELFDRLAINDLLLAIPSASRQRRNQIIEEIGGKHVSIRTLPGIMDLAHGRVTVNDLRELDIEDLLGRDPVPPDQYLLSRNITNKVVLVTGAGGSIGSELCRQIISLKPQRLVLLDSSEFNLYTIHAEMTQTILPEGNVEIIAELASVQSSQSLETIFARWSPQTIYHAAAYKHVPLVEDNIAEGIRNNVFGTLNTAIAALRHNVSDFVLISTDKAVRPTNVMGATKRLAEQILQALAHEGNATKYSMVRFGNVLGSSGSVVPLFRRQIKGGGPITITHREITRYFMTIPEAAQLVIQAGAMADSGAVFVLDMGHPVKIVNLAQKMIELSGLTVRDEKNPEGDIEIEEIGLRPGEKLYEELLIGNDPVQTSHSRIMKAKEHFIQWPELEPALNELLDTTKMDNKPLLRNLLKRLVPEYTFNEITKSTAA